MGWGGTSLDIQKLLSRLQAFLDLFTYGATIDASSGQLVLTSPMLTATANANDPGAVDLSFNVTIPDGAAHQLDLHGGLLLLGHLVCSGQAKISSTDLPRLDATSEGVVEFFSASNVARTML